MNAAENLETLLWKNRAISLGAAAGLALFLSGLSAFSAITVDAERDAAIKERNALRAELDKVRGEFGGTGSNASGSAECILEPR